jgi:hypothetical protein
MAARGWLQEGFVTYDEVLRRAKDVRDILPLYDVATGAMVIAVLGARGEPDHAFRIPVELAAEFRAIMLEEMYRRAN